MGLGKSIVSGLGREVGRSVARAGMNKVMKGADANHVIVNGGKGSGSTKLSKPAKSEYKFDISPQNKKSTIETKLFTVVRTFDQKVFDLYEYNKDVLIVESIIKEAEEFYLFKKFDTEVLNELKNSFEKSKKENIESFKSLGKKGLVSEAKKLKKEKRFNTILLIVLSVLFLPVMFSSPDEGILMPIIGLLMAIPLWRWIRKNTKLTKVTLAHYKLLSEL